MTNRLSAVICAGVAVGRGRRFFAGAARRPAQTARRVVRPTEEAARNAILGRARSSSESRSSPSPTCGMSV